MAEASVGTALVSVFFGAAGGGLVNLWLQGRLRWLEMQTVCRAVAREVLLNCRAMKAEAARLAEQSDRVRKDAAAKRASADAPAYVYMAQVPAEFRPKLDWRTKIYESNASKIGVLPAWLALRTLKFYRSFMDLMEEMPDPDSAKEITADQAERLSLKLVDVVRYGEDRVINQLEGHSQTSYSRFLWLHIVNHPLIVRARVFWTSYTPPNQRDD